jgi:hypothetical protein
MSRYFLLGGTHPHKNKSSFPLHLGQLLLTQTNPFFLSFPFFFGRKCPHGYKSHGFENPSGYIFKMFVKGVGHLLLSNAKIARKFNVLQTKCGGD